MNVTIKRIFNKSISITVTVIMAATCFAVIDTGYSYAAKKEKVTSVTLTNVGDVYTIEKGKSMKLTYSIKASKKKYKKVKWKSSNKKVVKVTKKGKIKAKEKGVAYITVYSKTNKKKDRVKIVVGTPVTSVTISGSKMYVEKGNQQKLSVTVKPANASDRGLTWESSNNAIATVSQSGVVTGKKKGTVMIKAFAKDGTGKYGWIEVKVVELKRSDAVFIAHRGYSSIAPENTLAAFALASQYNFHGAEMDVWESYSYNKEVPNPDYLPPEEDPEAQGGSKVEPKSTNGSEIQAMPESEPQGANELEGLKEEWTETSDANEAEPLENDKDEPLDIGEPEPQNKDAVEQQDVDEFADEMETGDQVVRAAGLRNTDSPTMTITTFDLNVMHNQMTEDMCGKSKNVDIRTINDTNREQYPIRNGNRVSSYSTLYIPTLDQVLETLYKANKKTGHNTLPVIELKQGSYSAAAIERVLDLIEQYGGKATIISFEELALSQAQTEIDKRVMAGTIVKGDVQTQYLVTNNIKSGVNTCVSNHFDGISIKYTEVTQSIVDYAHKKGLIVAAWTMPSMTEAARMIDLGVDRITSDYKLFED